MINTWHVITTLQQGLQLANNHLTAVQYVPFKLTS